VEIRQIDGHHGLLAESHSPSVIDLPLTAVKILTSLTDKPSHTPQSWDCLGAAALALGHLFSPLKWVLQSSSHLQLLRCLFSPTLAHHLQALESLSALAVALARVLWACRVTAMVGQALVTLAKCHSVTLEGELE
jgi:hypothetical protein